MPDFPPLTTGEGNTGLAVAYADADYVLRWLRQTNAPPNIVGLQERATATLAECGRLREQLDAARQALAPFVTRGTGPDRPARAPRWEVGGQYVVWLEKGEWERARAALGVEGPAAGDGQP